MILYLDTSALVPLLIQEPTSPTCGELWDDADKVTVTRLVYIEAVAALALAERMGRISEHQARGGRAILDDLWPIMDVIELDQLLMLEAATMAIAHGLRGYDATHCAAAAELSNPELVAASGDDRLLQAWRRLGINVVDTKQG